MPEKRSENKRKSFLKKYGFVGEGIPTGISKETRDAIKAMHEHSEALIKAGEAAGKLDTTRYGA